MGYEVPRLEELGTLEELTGKSGYRADACGRALGDGDSDSDDRFNCSGQGP